MASRRTEIRADRFESKRKNPIELGDDSNLEPNLKPIKIGGKNSILELSNDELIVRGTIDASAITVDGASVQTGTDAGATQLNELSDVTYSSGDLAVSLLDTIAVEADLTLDVVGDIELNADGGDINFKDDTASLVSINNTNTKFYYPSSATSYCQLEVTSNRGATTLSTQDPADSDSGSITFAPEGRIINEAEVGGIYIKEIPSAGGDGAGYGQLWIESTNPNKLRFRNDAGDDITITSGSELYQKYVYDSQFVGYSAAATAVYLPINGYVVDVTSLSTRNEFASFIAPYNGTIEKFAFRSEIAQDGTFRILVQESSDGTEVPGTTSFRTDVTYDIADDTYQEIDITSPSIGSANIPMTKGKIYAIQLTTPAISYDSNVTIVFKWDITT